MSQATTKNQQPYIRQYKHRIFMSTQQVQQQQPIKLSSPRKLRGLAAGDKLTSLKRFTRRKQNILGRYSSRLFENALRYMSTHQALRRNAKKEHLSGAFSSLKNVLATQKRRCGFDRRAKRSPDTVAQMRCRDRWVRSSRYDHRIGTRQYGAFRPRSRKWCARGGC